MLEQSESLKFLVRVLYILFIPVCSFLFSYLRAKKKEKDQKKKERRNRSQRLRFAQPCFLFDFVESLMLAIVLRTRSQF